MELLLRQGLISVRGRGPPGARLPTPSSHPSAPMNLQIDSANRLPLDSDLGGGGIDPRAKDRVN